MALKTLGPMTRGSATPIEFAFYGFNGGLNVKDPPELVGDNDLTIATNVYLQSGGVRFRNGMNAYGTSIGNLTGLVLARFYQDVLNGNTVSPETVALLGQYNGNLYTMTSGGTNTLVGSIGGSTASAMTTARIQNPNGQFFPAGLTDCTVICTGSGGPYVYDGTHLYTPAGWSSASGARWCAVVNGILWFGGIPKYPNQIFGTGDGILQSMETLPAIRNFVFSAPVQGLCALGSGANAALVVGMNTGISVLYGTGPSTFYRQDVPMTDGVTAGRTMIADRGIAYFLGHNAVYQFDGTSVPQAISYKIEPWILGDPFTPGYPFKSGSRGLSWAAIYNNRLHLGYCSTNTTPDAILVYDLNVKGWTVLTTTPGLNGITLLDAPSDAAPFVALAGSATTGAAYTWDYVPATTTTAVTDNGANVFAQVQTKYFKLGVPGTYKALQRFYPEFQVAGTFAAAFTVSVDYGVTTTNSTSVNPSTASDVLVWDQGLWDSNVWGGLSAFYPFGYPTSRIDMAGTQGDAFAFGVTMTTNLAPWIWTGGTGVFNQRGRV